MREIVKADQPFDAVRGHRRRAPWRSSPTSRTRSRSSSGSGARGRGADDLDSGEVGGGDTISVYRNTPEFLDLCKGPHVPTTAPPRPLQAAAGVGRLLAGQREGSDAAAHLRHGVGVRRRVKAHLEMLVEAEKRDHRRLATDLDLLSFPQRDRRRPRRVASQGGHRPQADGGLQPPAPPGRRLRVRVHAAPHEGAAVRDQRPPRTGTPTACTRRWRWTTARTT